MKNKGFTLVELLAVIVVLAIIIAITTPNIINVINDSKNNLSERQKEQVINAAKMYGTKNVTKEKAETEGDSITIGKLQDYGYLDDKDVDNNNELKNCTINIGWENEQLNYIFGEGCPDKWK